MRLHDQQPSLQHSPDICVHRGASSTTMAEPTQQIQPEAFDATSTPRRQRKLSARSMTRHMDTVLDLGSPVEGAQRLLQAFFGGQKLRTSQCLCNVRQRIHPDPSSACDKTALVSCVLVARCQLTRAPSPVSKGFYGITRMNEGITNIVLHCHRIAADSSSPHPKDVLIRVYGAKTEVGLVLSENRVNRSLLWTDLSWVIAISYHETVSSARYPSTMIRNWNLESESTHIRP